MKLFATTLIIFLLNQNLFAQNTPPPEMPIPPEFSQQAPPQGQSYPPPGTPQPGPQQNGQMPQQQNNGQMPQQQMPPPQMQNQPGFPPPQGQSYPPSQGQSYPPPGAPQPGQQNGQMPQQPEQMPQQQMPPPQSQPIELNASPGVPPKPKLPDDFELIEIRPYFKNKTRLGKLTATITSSQNDTLATVSADFGDCKNCIRGASLKGKLGIRLYGNTLKDLVVSRKQSSSIKLVNCNNKVAFVNTYTCEFSHKDSTMKLTLKLEP